MCTEHFKKFLCADNELSFPNMMRTMMKNKKMNKKKIHSMSVRIKDTREVRANDQCIHVRTYMQEDNNITYLDFLRAHFDEVNGFIQPG